MSDQRTSAAAQEATLLAFDEYELDIPRFELRRAGEVVPLEPQVFEVLAYLVRHAGRVVPKDELLDAIWPERYVTDGALNSRIMTARKAIGDSGQEQRYIKTVHGRGYRFVGDLSMPSTPAAQIAGEPPPAPPPLPLRPPDLGLGPTSPATSFVGRDEELERLGQLLDHPGARLISIVGPGGVGKTRLAREAGARAAAAGHEVVFVPLEAVIDAREMPAAIASALGFPLRSEDPATELLAVLQPRRELIILDNVEQLIEGTRYLHDILRAAPGLTLLVTTRSVLGLGEEWILRVSGLSVDGSIDDSGAVRLFLERAGQANAGGFSPGPEDLEDILRICRLVDGMPLAIELAASLTRYLPPGEIAAQIQRDMSVLSSELRDAPGRHQSIPGLLEGSCRHLAPEELRALESLAVFEAPCSAVAASRVGGASLAILRRLVDQSLVQAAEGRFSLHPLMRQFLIERLGDRIAELRQVHAEYYADLMASSVPDLEGGGQVQATWRIDADLANVAAAWRWAAENARLDLMDRMAYPLFLVLTFRGRFYEAHELLQVGITAARGAGDDGQELLAMLLTSRSWVLFRFGRGPDASRDIQEAIAIQTARELPPRPGYGLDPRLALTVLYHGAGEYAKAYETAMTVLEGALARGERTGIAFASWIGGSARLRQARLVCEEQPDGTALYAPMDGEDSSGAVEEANRLARAAGAVLAEMGDSWLSAFVEIEMGLIAGARGDRETACNHYRRAYDLRKAFNDPQGMASAQVYLAGTLTDLSRFQEADVLHRDVAALAASIGDSNNLAEVERSMGVAAMSQGDCALAFQHSKRAMQRSIAIGFTNNIASILGTFGRIFLAIREPALAASCFATIVQNPASTPFARARSQAFLDSLSRTLPARSLADIRRRAAQLDLNEAAMQALTTLETMEGRLAACSAEAGLAS